MGTTKENIETITEVIKFASESKELIKLVVDLLMDQGPEIKRIPEAMIGWGADQRIKTIAKYRTAGFSKEEAISMTMDDFSALRRSIDRQNAAIKK